MAIYKPQWTSELVNYDQIGWWTWLSVWIYEPTNTSWFINPSKNSYKYHKPDIHGNFMGNVSLVIPIDSAVMAMAIRYNWLILVISIELYTL